MLCCRVCVSRLTVFLRETSRLRETPRAHQVACTTSTATSACDQNRPQPSLHRPVPVPVPIAAFPSLLLFHTTSRLPLRIRLRLCGLLLRPGFRPLCLFHPPPPRLDNTRWFEFLRLPYIIGSPSFPVRRLSLPHLPRPERSACLGCCCSDQSARFRFATSGAFFGSAASDTSNPRAFGFSFDSDRSFGSDGCLFVEIDACFRDF